MEKGMTTAEIIQATTIFGVAFLAVCWGSLYFFVQFKKRDLKSREEMVAKAKGSMLVQKSKDAEE
jgi:ATP:corrinoid adenosyltransferase